MNKIIEKIMMRGTLSWGPSKEGKMEELFNTIIQEIYKVEQQKGKVKEEGKGKRGGPKVREKYLRFGDFIKKIRQEDPRELTLKDVSKILGISLSFLSDIENNRRKPFDKEKIEIFAKEFNLSDEDKAKLYDLAARDRGEIPSDIEDIMMYSEVGDMARFALRQSNAGKINEEDWEKFIREIESKGGK